jgi:hypothetical protein
MTAELHIDQRNSRTRVLAHFIYLCRYLGTHILLVKGEV